MSKPLVIIGIDGAVPDLTTRWANEGYLPNLQSLISRGRFSRLRSVPNRMSPAAWTSFMTGCNPGNHGIFNFVEHVRTGAFRFTNGSMRNRPTFWEVADRMGKKTATLFVPMSYPARPLDNGVQISGWLTPSLNSEGATYPADLGQTISQQFPEFTFHVPFKELIVRGNTQEALDNKLQSVQVKADIGRYVADLDDWDMFFIVFEEADQVQHFFWHYMDENHPEHPPQSAFRYAIRDVYQEIDRAIGTLLDAFEPDAPTIVISDHGFQLNSRGQLYVKPALRALDYEVPRPQTLVSRFLSQGYTVVDKYFPTRLKHILASALPSVRSTVLSNASLAEIDLNQSSAFSLYLNRISDIWINRNGRESSGTVSPSEYELLCQEIAQIFLSARDSATNKPVVAEVLTKEEAYSGRHVEHSADLIVKFSQTYVHGLKLVDRDGREITVSDPIAEDIRTGDHDDYGILIDTSGDNSCTSFGIDISLQDLFPYLLYRLDLPAHTISELHIDSDLHKLPMSEDWTATANVEANNFVTESLDYSEQEERVIEKRLRDLGYM